MTENNIENIRSGAIQEIKAKIKKNRKYVHPCNKDFQDDIKRLRFDNANRYIYWMQQNGILANPTDIKRKELISVIKNSGCKNQKEYREKCVQRLGFENLKDYRDDRARKRGYDDDTDRRRKGLSMSENKNCTSYFGIEIAEKYVYTLFEDAIRMPNNNPGFDWICKKGEKVQHAARCLCKSKDSWVWVFGIKYNNVTDYFILTGWDNRYSLNPLHVWIFHKDDIVRGRKFWRRDSFSIINRPEYLAEFQKHEITDKLEKLKELCKILKKKKNGIIQEISCQ